MMTPPKISLIAPVYGVEPYIRTFAESVLGQSYADIEFIFVNDGTPDASIEILEQVILEKYSHRQSRIKIVHKQNEGLPKARQTGLENATGEYILFADSDDWLETDAVEKIMAMADRTHADLIYFDLIKEYGDHQSFKREKDYSAADKQEYICNLFNYRSQGYTVTKCFRRRLWSEHPIHTPKLGMHEDICLMSQIIFYAESIVHLPEYLYHYRKDNPNAFCSQKRKKRHLASSENMLDLYAHYRNQLKGSPIEQVADGILLRAGWHNLLYRHNFPATYPWLREDLHKARISSKYRTPVLFQLLTKLLS